MIDTIKVRGAREHNLKNVDVDIPKNKLIVFTGLSGSGKSSLAFDTIFAEGQRRYVESLSSYARQFLGQMNKPDVDKIDGLSPAIAIDQKSTSQNPRSTVGTVTEIYDYLRLLFARVGHPHCPSCGREISTQTPQQIVDAIVVMALQNATKQKGWRLLILAPVVKDRKGEYNSLLDELLRRGFSRARIDGKIHDLNEDISLIKTNRHTIEAVVDRLIIPKEIGDLDFLTKKGEEIRKRLTDSVEQALKLTSGSLVVAEVLDDALEFPDNPKETEDHLFSEHFACPQCNISLPDLEPRTFSFNSPHGACPECHGLGVQKEIEANRIFNPNLSILEGGIMPWPNIGEGDTWLRSVLDAVARKHSFSLDAPIDELPEAAKTILLQGTGNEKLTITYTRKSDGERHEYSATFEGIISHMMRRYNETQSDYIRTEIEKFMVEKPCPVCDGKRLRQEALSVTIRDRNIADLVEMAIDDIANWLGPLDKELVSNKEKEIATPITKELNARLSFLQAVGLNYLTLDRTANTLSGGEAQRIRLASQIGSGLSGVLYVLDEPSIGLHPRDHSRLLDTLKSLRDLGNTILVVEHDYETMIQADLIYDFGPNAGEHGGQIIASGTIEEIIDNDKSITGQYLSKKKNVSRPKLEMNPQDKKKLKDSEDKMLKIVGAQQHNLKDVDVEIPLGKFVCVTGVSGSGKSTLIMDILNQALAIRFYHSKVVPGKHRTIEGIENIDKVVNIDQSPIGRTPRSNPATYTGVFTGIRDLFTMTNEAKARGYQKGRFSFNVKGGRCENCSGDGQIKIEMQFLPDVYVDCEVCQGKRYNRETLEIKYRDKNIADVLEMTIDEAAEFFANIPQIQSKLATIQDVGLGYVRLGQPAPTLSGGEAQRMKLAAELSKKSTGKTLYILDEPTTGLHFADIQKLVNVLHQLVVQGNTVLVIEHNLDVIKTADWIIDLGPEGGDKGGDIVATGTVSDVTQNEKSYTGKFLKAYLEH
ncbi:excinuclease ABC subunit UvrA [candidate division WWE3 bacterium]|uniref:UvrABC system protein A n=1 Tax=candidate division WWE3 bacterium TaxID=2053526 RepID=A0A955LGW9_UNCKA|nr:excinuclease ABC subunit UvrA [candidate division WWE3 bacterium]